jgi:hypothetical protein
MGKVYWTRLCKVWHMKAWRKWFKLSQFFSDFKRENPCSRIWKHKGFVVVPWSEELSTKTLVRQY